jgi:hypothetical protein
MAGIATVTALVLTLIWVSPAESAVHAQARPSPAAVPAP